MSDPEGYPNLPTMIDSGASTPNMPGAPHHDTPQPRRHKPEFLYVEAPTYYQRQPVDPPAVFIAGGISNCPLWQPMAVDYFRAAPDPYVVLNPRREDFPIEDPTASWEQLCWEQHHIQLPNTHTMFYFPACDPSETTCPITWGEVGLRLGDGANITVGVDPGYPRRTDVLMWCKYHRPDMIVHSHLDHLLEDTRANLQEMGRDIGRLW